MDPVHVDTSSITWLGLSTLLLIMGGIAWQMHKTKQTLFEVVNGLFKRQNLSIIMGVIMVLNLAEALMAASLLLTSQKYSLNLFARFIGHMSISAASLACALFISDTVKSLWESLLALHLGAALVRAIRLIIVFNLAWILPCFNALIISNGLHETASLRLLGAYYFGSDKYYIYLLAKGNPAIGPGPLDIAYEPWDALSYPMATTLGITVIHIIFLALDLLIVLDPLDLKKKAAAEKEEKDEKDEKEPDQDKKADEDDPATANAYETSLLQVLKFYGLTGAVLKAKYKACQDITKGQTDSNRAGISNALHTLKVKIDAFNAAAHDDAKAASQKAEIVSDIKKTFESSPANGLGFGMSLPKLTKN